MLVWLLPMHHTNSYAVHTQVRIVQKYKWERTKHIVVHRSLVCAYLHQFRGDQLGTLLSQVVFIRYFPRWCIPWSFKVDPVYITCFVNHKLVLAKGTGAVLILNYSQILRYLRSWIWYQQHEPPPLPLRHWTPTASLMGKPRVFPITGVPYYLMPLYLIRKNLLNSMVYRLAYRKSQNFYWDLNPEPVRFVYTDLSH